MGCVLAVDAAADEDAVTARSASVSCWSGVMVGDSAAGTARKAAVQSSWSTRTCRLHSAERRFQGFRSSHRRLLEGAQSPSSGGTLLEGGSRLCSTPGTRDNRDRHPVRLRRFACPVRGPSWPGSCLHNHRSCVYMHRRLHRRPPWAHLKLPTWGLPRPRISMSSSMSAAAGPPSGGTRFCSPAASSYTQRGCP